MVIPLSKILHHWRIKFVFTASMLKSQLLTVKKVYVRWSTYVISNLLTAEWVIRIFYAKFSKAPLLLFFYPEKPSLRTLNLVKAIFFFSLTFAMQDLIGFNEKGKKQSLSLSNSNM